MTKTDTEKHKKQDLLAACLLSFLLTAGLLAVLYAVSGFAPFGDSASLAWQDANNQYLDLFLLYKRLLSGSAGLSYSFSKMLGGTNVALFAYYLASPLNLLLAFFPTDRILVFFDLLILLKLSLASASCALFLGLRFPGSCTAGAGRRHYVVLLSACYALSQYAVSQCSNVMWLDGLILLPLILLGVWAVVNGGPLWRLSVPAALAILFNWYTAGISCLFSAGWFVVEAVLSDQVFAGERKTAFSAFLRAALRYVFAMLLGVLAAAALFFPAVAAMASNEKGQLHWYYLRVFSFRASVWSIIESSVYGGICTDERLSLFCGALPLVGTLALFTKKNCFREKAVAAVVLLFLILMFCWIPLYSLFNLLADPTSFFCRFSFVQIFALVFCAGLTLLGTPAEEKAVPWLPGLLYAGLLILVFLLDPYENPLHVYLTAGMIVLMSLSLQGDLRGRKGFCVLTCLLVLLDLGWNTWLFFQANHREDGQMTLAYIRNQQGMIDSLRAHDPGAYRISQLKNRGTGALRRSAVYDEAQAYGFWSIVEYTSTVDDRQLTFLENGGYRNIGNMMSVVNTSVLGTDSVLGVRYVLSDYPIHGLTEEPGLFSFDGKRVYRNPFALPLAFLTDTAEPEELVYEDPFQYQNDLYSALLGESTALYRPLSFERTLIGEPTDKDRVQVYTLALPEGNLAVYGNFPWKMADGPILDLNGRKQIAYAGWLTPSAFYVPTDPGDSSAAVSMHGNATLEEGEEQFYALDLDALRSVTDRLKAREVNDAVFEDGHVTVTAEAGEGDSLFLSVPVNQGWTVLVNGVPVEPECFADLFYLVPLSAGENRVELRYQVPGLRLGLLTSAAALLLLTVVTVLPSRRKKL